MRRWCLERATQALRAGAADRARLWGKVDGRSEELDSGEILADREDHVGGGNEDRTEHLGLSQHGRPRGAGGVQDDSGEAVEVREHEGSAEGADKEDGRRGL